MWSEGRALSSSSTPTGEARAASSGLRLRPPSRSRTISFSAGSISSTGNRRSPDSTASRVFPTSSSTTSGADSSNRASRSTATSSGGTRTNGGRGDSPGFAPFFFLCAEEGLRGAALEIDRGNERGASVALRAGREPLLQLLDTRVFAGEPRRLRQGKET